MPRRLVLAAFLSFFYFLSSCICYLVPVTGLFFLWFHIFPLFLLPLLSLPEVSACLCFHTKTFTFSTPMLAPLSPRTFCLTHTAIVKPCGPRCSILYLLHSACGLARNPVNPGECIGRARPRIYTTVASGHSSKPHKETRRTLFVGPCYLAHCSLMVLVGLNWGQSVGTVLGSKEHQGHLAAVLHHCFCDIISSVQQKAA